MRRRPIKVDSHVWCDAHCAIQAAERDHYEEGFTECAPKNWRPVYVLGEPGEIF